MMLSGYLLVAQEQKNVVLKYASNTEIYCNIVKREDGKIFIQNKGKVDAIDEKNIKSINGKSIDRFFLELENNKTISLPLKDGKLHYEKILELSGSKTELYTKSRIWFSETFKSAEAVLQMDDKDAGIMIGKAYSDIYVSNKFYDEDDIKTKAYFTIKVQVKENKCKLEIYDVYYYSYPTSGFYSGVSYVSGTPSITSYPENYFLPEIQGKRTVLKESYKFKTLKLITFLSESFEDNINKKITIDDF